MKRLKTTRNYLKMTTWTDKNPTKREEVNKTPKNEKITPT